ncbi:hypothetical protein MG293_017592 [Ovis ammon polii]|uniref:Uncharacterized protein n=1 Tax=Ovis ammon polii TaxID=230172 RepID=A0AAD4TTI0_OVIAM|nr:hypothetical protein MG293_017592 [Ovis ammon polii]
MRIMGSRLTGLQQNKCEGLQWSQDPDVVQELKVELPKTISMKRERIPSQRDVRFNFALTELIHNTPSKRQIFTTTVAILRNDKVKSFDCTTHTCSGPKFQSINLASSQFDIDFFFNAKDEEADQNENPEQNKASSKFPENHHVVKPGNYREKSLMMRFPVHISRIVYLLGASELGKEVIPKEWGKPLMKTPAFIGAQGKTSVMGLKIDLKRKVLVVSQTMVPKHSE